MPRKRKAARAFRQLRSSVHTRIREKFAPDSWELIGLMVENFHKALPTEAERRAFAEIYPEIFYKLFGFEASAFDQYPALEINHFGCCVFRRENFFAEFLAEHPPRLPFTPPNLTDVQYRDRQAVMAKARMEWWRANEWPISEAERRFVIRGPERRPYDATQPIPPRRQSPALAWPPERETAVLPKGETR
jgi:hypothetical protein